MFCTIPPHFSISLYIHKEQGWGLNHNPRCCCYCFVSWSTVGVIVIGLSCIADILSCSTLLCPVKLSPYTGTSSNALSYIILCTAPQFCLIANPVLTYSWLVQSFQRFLTWRQSWWCDHTPVSSWLGRQLELPGTIRADAPVEPGLWYSNWMLYWGTGWLLWDDLGHAK